MGKVSLMILGIIILLLQGNAGCAVPSSQKEEASIKEPMVEQIAPEDWDIINDLEFLESLDILEEDVALLGNYEEIEDLDGAQGDKHGHEN
jgi:hypothetical protein